MSLAAIERKIATLTAEMQRAAEAEDFEAAARLRNEIASLRGHDPSGTVRVRRPPPGEMGLGTHIPVAERPPGWRPPRKPDPMTRSTTGRKR